MSARTSAFLAGTVALVLLSYAFRYWLTVGHGQPYGEPAFLRFLP